MLEKAPARNDSEVKGISRVLSISLITLSVSKGTQINFVISKMEKGSH